jgi:hypothetical protein
MKVACSSETSVDFQRTTQCYIPEDRILKKEIFVKFCSLCTVLSGNNGDFCSSWRTRTEMCDNIV